VATERGSGCDIAGEEAGFDPCSSEAEYELAIKASDSAVGGLSMFQPSRLCFITHSLVLSGNHIYLHCSLSYSYVDYFIK